MRIRIRDPGSGIFLTRDPESGMEKFGSGIRDKHSRFAILEFYVWTKKFQEV
jgi:hypothetical protein